MPNSLNHPTAIKAAWQGLSPDLAAWHYAAIVESSEDAILSKDLSGVILSWNRGAERLFGYSADEAVGRSVMLIIPLDRQGEEPGIIERIRRGVKVEPFETVRQRKDGTLVEISVSVSPIRDLHGNIVGASKIARDITELKRARERQYILLREMSHRVKNLFALSSSIVGLSARSAKSTQELATSARERLAALARAHSLTFSHGEAAPQDTTLHAMIRILTAPFDEPGHPRIILNGVDTKVSGAAVASLALLIHEFATNATKYGALSNATGWIDVTCSEDGDNVVVVWVEHEGPAIVPPDGGEGFGGVLSRIAVANQLGGQITRDWRPEGLAIRLSLPRERLAD